MRQYHPLERKISEKIITEAWNETGTVLWDTPIERLVFYFIDMGLIRDPQWLTKENIHDMLK